MKACTQLTCRLTVVADGKAQRIALDLLLLLETRREIGIRLVGCRRFSIDGAEAEDGEERTLGRQAAPLDEADPHRQAVIALLAGADGRVDEAPAKGRSAGELGIEGDRRVADLGLCRVKRAGQEAGALLVALLQLDLADLACRPRNDEVAAARVEQSLEALVAHLEGDKGAEGTLKRIADLLKPHLDELSLFLSGREPAESQQRAERANQER